VPLLVFTARCSVMGTFVNRTVTTAIGSAATGIVVVLNVSVLVRTFGTGRTQYDRP
jgi:Mn2+/Fe2+ NRAMP family transporter